MNELFDQISADIKTAMLARDKVKLEAHVRRIGLYAAEMAIRLGWDQERVDAIRAAAPMHDIGKVGVPDAVLQ